MMMMKEMRSKKEKRIWIQERMIAIRKMKGKMKIIL
jgi:hypothetical protein